MNNITVSGNIGRDCEMRYMPDGKAVANFSVADNQGKEKPAIFWNCSLYGKRAEALAQYLLKGQAVTVVGNVTEREWQDKEGTTRKTMDIHVNDVALQGGKRDDAKPKEVNENNRTRPKGHEFMDDDAGIPF